MKLVYFKYLYIRYCTTMPRKAGPFRFGQQDVTIFFLTGLHNIIHHRSSRKLGNLQVQTKQSIRSNESATWLELWNRKTNICLFFSWFSNIWNKIYLLFRRGSKESTPRRATFRGCWPVTFNNIYTVTIEWNKGLNRLWPHGHKCVRQYPLAGVEGLSLAAGGVVACVRTNTNHEAKKEQHI